MTIVFKYKTIKRPDGTQVKTPSIPLLLNGKENIQTIALLDSGADISAISKDLAEILGLDISGKIHYPVLLGRAGFFDKFVICFDQAREKISLKRISR